MSEKQLYRKKVLYLITKSNWGGAQRYVYDLATTLDHHVWEPMVACGGSGTLVDMLHHAGIATITLPDLERDISLQKEWRFFWSFYRLLRTERPAVLHLNSSKASGLGALAGRLARVPQIIVTAHGWAFNEDRPRWQKLLIKILHWLTILLSHRTIAVSSGLLRQLRWPGTERKMKVINPGRTIGAMYDTTEARAELVRRHPALAQYEHDPWLGVIAELHPIKRHAVLITAVASLVRTHPTVRLICIGDGSIRTELEALVQAHNLAAHVFFLGSVVEAARFLKAFTIAVLPSKSESYGYVLHEAGLAGVPVVATAVGGIPDIIRHEVSGLLVPPDDSEYLTNALAQLLDNTTRAEQFASALQKSVSARTVALMTAATTALYQH